jgi:hypothetical protein
VNGGLKAVLPMSLPNWLPIVTDLVADSGTDKMQPQPPGSGANPVRIASAAPTR